MITATTAPDPRAEQRTADILTLVRTAFAEKGFDGASMQDLARAAGMSVGNFYRYFPSKSAIVDALIANDLSEMERDFAEIQSATRPFDGLRQQLHIRVCEKNSCADGQIWCEIAAVARRKPEIGLAALHMESTVAHYLLKVFAIETGLAEAEAIKRFSSQAAFIVMLVKSAKMQPETDAASRDALNTLIIKTIDQTLDDISSAAVKDE
jgi:AcrR family transcriptional regulator